MTLTPRQARHEQRRTEHYARQYATAPDPKARAQVTFSRLRALYPAQDQTWPRIEAALEQFLDREKART
jgi:hypothetical protein